jgi:hypothetical protein
MIHMIIINARSGHGYVEYIPQTLTTEEQKFALTALQARFYLGASVPCWQGPAMCMHSNEQTDLLQ